MHSFRAHVQVMAEREEALRVAEEWEARCQQLESETEALQAEVQRQEMELSAGKADAETRGTAVAKLEAMLSNLAKAQGQGRHAGTPPGHASPWGAIPSVHIAYN